MHHNAYLKNRPVTRAIAVVLGLCVTVLTLSVPPVAHAALPTGTSKFVPLSASRLADTRASSGAFGFTRRSTTMIRVVVAGKGGVPANATAAVIELTGLASAGAGSLMVTPAGSALPAGANVVFDRAGQTATNLVHVRLGTGGAIDIQRSVGAEIIVDVVGAYAPVADATTDGRLATSARGAIRAATSVPVAARGESVIDLATTGLSEDAAAVVLTLTVDHAAPGGWTARGNGFAATAAVALMVDGTSTTRSNQTVVRFNGADHKVRISSTGGGRVSVDLVAWYTGSSSASSTDGLFVPTAPARRLDTRIGRSLPPFGPFTAEFSPGTALTVAALAANVQTIGAWDAGRVTSRPAGVSAAAVTASAPTAPRQSTASHFITRASNRGVAMTTTSGTHMIVDVAGWFLGPRATATIAPVVNPRFSPTKVTQVMWNDAGGTKVRAVATPATSSDTNLDRIADRGVGAAFKDHSTLGARGNVMIFGHRTVHGAMFRYLNSMKVGGTFSLKGADGHWYHYRVVSVGVSSPTYNTISSRAASWTPITAQLVACSKLDGTPTSLRYRIVVTGRLVSVS